MYLGGMSTRPSESRLAAPQALRDGWAFAALERDGILSKSDAETLRAEAPEWVATLVVTRDFATAERAAQVLAKAAHVGAADFERADAAAAQFLPEAAARRYLAFPLSITDRTIRIATANPLDLDAEHAIGFASGRGVEFLYALPEVLLPRIEDLYRPERSIERLVSGLGTEATIESYDETAEGLGTAAIEAPASKLVEATIADAVREGASDVHLEPTSQGLVIRYRVDGVLREVMRVPRGASSAVTRRIKVTAGLDITDPLRPHDGRASARIDGKPWDLRVSSVPIARLGEKIVIRLLDPASTHLKLDAMGLGQLERESLNALLGHREGIVLVTGPTGSGKTSMLYAALETIRSPGINVVTVEDPVEYRLAGVSQIEVNEKQGFTFANALRSVLRQDPDIILLGEIRDLETAQTAWQAALSGHFVLSTLHTNDAAAAVMRLRDIGVEAFKIAAALKGVVAQRLVRRLCTHCAADVGVETLPEAARPRPDDGEVHIRKAAGCARCAGSGYRGRFAIQEVLDVDPAIAKLIAEEAMSAVVVEAARKRGMHSLWESGLRRVWLGDTGYEEVVRVVGEPVADRDAGEPAAPPLPAAPDPARPLVLIADDDPTQRAIVAATLEAESFATVEADDGLMALEQARRLHPALLLLDMEMPKMGGFEVLAALRERLSGRGVPVIVVTSRGDAETESRCIELGAEDYIVKPIRPATLVARVRAVLRRVAAT